MFYTNTIAVTNTIIGRDTKIMQPINLYGCEIGEKCFIGPFVEIQRDVKIGNNTRISSHSFICEQVTIGKNCFIGHGVMFTNDKFTDDINVKNEYAKTTIGDNVRIGSNSTLLPVRIGDNVVIGAGSVVTHDIESNTIVCGNPARYLKKINFSNKN